MRRSLAPFSAALLHGTFVDRDLRSLVLGRPRFDPIHRLDRCRVSLIYHSYGTPSSGGGISRTPCALASVGNSTTTSIPSCAQPDRSSRSSLCAAPDL